MLAIGKFNKLEVLRLTPPGAFLGDEEGDEVLLPNKYVPEDCEVGNELEVFVYRDSEDRIIATTITPKIQRDEFAYLQVKQVNKIGAFMDWGLEKDLLVPFGEQKMPMKEGRTYLVHLKLDVNTWRLLASAKTQRYLEKEEIDLERGQEVELLICEETDMGFTVIVDHTYQGLVYRNEIFRSVETGEKTVGFVKEVREDGKVDISLEKVGFKSVEPNRAKILDRLEANNGFLPLHDKSDPEKIKLHLGMSKKLFKKAVGGLYKDRRIRLEKDGIYLNKS